MVACVCLYVEGVWFVFPFSFALLVSDSNECATVLQFYKNFCSNLEDIIWKPPTESSKSRVSKSKSKKR